MGMISKLPSDIISLGTVLLASKTPTPHKTLEELCFGHSVAVRRLFLSPEFGPSMLAMELSSRGR